MRQISESTRQRAGSSSAWVDEKERATMVRGREWERTARLERRGMRTSRIRERGHHHHHHHHHTTRLRALGGDGFQKGNPLGLTSRLRPSQPSCSGLSTCRHVLDCCAKSRIAACCLPACLGGAGLGASARGRFLATTWLDPSGPSGPSGSPTVRPDDGDGDSDGTLSGLMVGREGWGQDVDIRVPGSG